MRDGRSSFSQRRECADRASTFSLNKNAFSVCFNNIDGTNHAYPMTVSLDDLFTRLRFVESFGVPSVFAPTFDLDLDLDVDALDWENAALKTWSGR